MASRSKTSKTARGRRISRSLKEHHAKARQIRKMEGLSYLEARSRVKDVFIETVRRGERRRAQAFIQISRPGYQKPFWRRVRPDMMSYIKGMLQTRKEALRGSFPRWYSKEEVRRSQGMFSYWSIVDTVAGVFRLPLKRSRELSTRMRREMTRVGRLHGKKQKYRMRDVLAVLIYTDRYPVIRNEFGI